MAAPDRGTVGPLEHPNRGPCWVCEGLFKRTDVWATYTVSYRVLPSPGYAGPPVLKVGVCDAHALQSIAQGALAPGD